MPNFLKFEFQMVWYFVVMVWVPLDRGSMVVEGRLVVLVWQGIPVPSVAGFTSSS